ncbi:MAG: ISNCY family transposase [Terriglobia bacterium]
MTRVAIPQKSFADLELERQGVVLDAVLLSISDLLDEHGELVEMVHQDLLRGLKRPETGREGMSAEKVLRAFVLQRVKNWDFRELRERIADGYTLRQFTQFYSDAVPSHQAFHRAFQRLQPETVRELNEAVVQAAVEMEIEDGKKLRVDTTVVETDIHHPTDAGLLWDSVRVITRLVKRVGEEIEGLVQGFPNRCRRARRRMQELQRMDRQQRPRQQRRTYQDLLKVTQEVIHKSREIVGKSEKIQILEPKKAAKVKELREEIAHYCELAEKVVNQTCRRVLQGEKVPAEEKIVSIFESHTAIIKRGKVVKPVEFGRKIFLAESAQGLITNYQVLKGNPTDDGQVAYSLQRHEQAFGTAPEVYAADRGFYSQENLQRCETAGVRLVSVPRRGGKNAPEGQAREKSREFRAAQRFRAGIEGRISVLFRGRGMKRCLLEGEERFELFVGAAVLANNLLMIAKQLEKRKARSRRRR